MTLNYVTLICDLGAGDGYYLKSGTALLTPSAVVTDAADHIIVSKTPVPVTFGAPGPPQVRLVATDNAGLQPSGWAWTFTPPAGSGISPFSFFLPFAGGGARYLSAQIPVQPVAAMGAYLPLNHAGISDWANVVLQYGADPSGAADSTSAIQAALDGLPSTGGVAYLPAGTYKVSSTLTMANTLYAYVRGAGRQAATIRYTGSGDCLRVYNTDTGGLLTSGGLLDFTIDGTSAAAGACGLHFGDMRTTEIRIAVRNFSGVGSAGIHFDNQYSWTEDCFGYLNVSGNTSNLVFDVSAPAGGSYTATNASPCVFTCASPTFANGNQVVLSGGTPPTGFTNGTAYFVVGVSGTTFQLAATSGGAAINSTSTGSGTVTLATATNSFGYSNFDVEIFAKQNQDGVVFQNGALLYNSRLAVMANFLGSSSAQANAVLRITGQVPAGHPNAGGFSVVKSNRLDVQAECGTGTGSNVPQTIVFGTLASNALVGCTGILDFANGSQAFAVTNWTATGAVGGFTFMGIIRGDFRLNNATVGAGQNVSLSMQGAISYGLSLLGNTTGNLNVTLGDFFSQTLTQSITVNFNPGGGATLGAAQRKTIIIKQAASGGPYTVTWPHNASPSTTNPTVNWPGGTAPTMSAGAGAVDVYNLITSDGATWHGQAIQNVS